MDNGKKIIIGLIVCLIFGSAFGLINSQSANEALAYNSTRHRSSRVSYNKKIPTITSVARSYVRTTSSTATASTQTATGTTQPTSSVTIPSTTSAATAPATVNTSPAPVSTAVAPVTTAPTVVTASVSAPVNASNSYGIAAGGGLLFMNQTSLNSYFASLKELGVGWVRYDFEWGVIQPDNASSYQWTAIDRVVATAKSYGIETLGTIAYAPKWARDASCNTTWACPPASPAAYAKFASDVASRYKDSVKYWEIWNEPNIPVFWAPNPDSAKYAAILKAAYTSIKTANPSAVVMSAGLSPAEDAGGRIAPLTFMKNLYASGAKNFFDIVALHPYSFPASPDYAAVWNSWQQMTAIHQLMISNSDSSKKVWITEFGSPTGGSGSGFAVNQFTNWQSGSDFMTENAQSQIITNAAKLFKQDNSWLSNFFYYSLKDNGTSKSTTENFFGLIRYDGSQKPAFGTLKSIIAGN